MEIVWTPHAEEAMQDRQIGREQVLAAISSPEFTEPDPIAGRIRAFKRLPDHGNRWLRVVYEDIESSRVIVTLFLDRKAGRKR
jgi:hypothetical protein